MKKLESLEKYVITPNVRFYGGYIYDGEDIFLCDDTDIDKDYLLNIKQVIENGILKTNLKIEYKMRNGKKVKEKSYQEIELNKGQLLVYVEGKGFVISEYNMVTIDEAKNIYDLLKGERNDTEGNERKSIEDDRGN